MTDPNFRIVQITKPYLLKNAFILTELPVKDLDVLNSITSLLQGKRGEVLYRQGAFPKGAYWLKTGKIKIFQETPEGQRRTLYVYSDGDLLGYRQLITDEAFPISATLLEDCTIAFIPAETFRELLQNSTFFARNLLTALAKEFSIWMNRTTAFTQFPVRHRLILALLILHEQYRFSGSPPGVITMTRSDLAEYIGSSLETVVRALNSLKSSDLVRIKGRRILIWDTDGLADILEGENF